jgi:hypothetical protein
VRCRNCHYLLEGLTEHRCPECGAAFDPTNPDTFRLLQCRNCRYPLEGLGERRGGCLADNRCPECGSAFDPADLETVINLVHERDMTWKLLWIWAFLLLLFGLPLLVSLLQVARGR